MNEACCRLLPFAVADGATNMAADEALLESAVAGVASLRFYGWSEATLSLGYFQPERLRDADSRLNALPFVRRPTGGSALVHHHELTYALALPAGPPWQGKETRSLPWLCRMHGIIAAALRQFCVCTATATDSTPADGLELLCFRSLTPGDLIIGQAKVVGSAQRRRRGALLQHGSILLACSPAAPELPGILEAGGFSISPESLREAIRVEWDRETGWPLDVATWTAAEGFRADELYHTKYARSSWNCKR